jgi:hypothetical protein
MQGNIHTWGIHAATSPEGCREDESCREDEGRTTPRASAAPQQPSPPNLEDIWHAVARLRQRQVVLLRSEQLQRHHQPAEHEAAARRDVMEWDGRGMDCGVGGMGAQNPVSER